MYNLSAAALGEGSFHYPDTMLLQVSGPGAAAKASVALLTSALIGPGQLPIRGISLLYRLESPVKFYLTPMAEAHSHYNGKCLSLTDPAVTIMVEQLDKQQTKLTLKYLSSKLGQAEIEKLVKKITEDLKAEAFRFREAPLGRWVLYSSKNEIPHYISIEVEGDPERHLVYITIPGRRTACFHCGEDSYWSSVCSAQRSPKVQGPQPAPGQ